MVELSLVTGLRNRPDSFRRLLNSIIQRTPMSWELVVSDASDEPIDPTGFPSSVRIIPERPRLGMTEGYNRAFQETEGTWVIWLNDDAEVQPHYAEEAIRFMESHPEIGLGALHYCEPPHRGYHVNTCCYGMLYANFGILRRELGNQIGWFDPAIPMYGNDNSLAYRVLLAGKGIAAIPEARIWHHSEQDAMRMENNSSRCQDAAVLKARYGPKLSEMMQVYESTRRPLVRA